MEQYCFVAKKEIKMNIIVDKLSVICTDNTNYYELYVDNVFDSDDYIEIVSQIYNPSLNRGWVGELIFKGHGSDYANDIEQPVTHQISNALLQNVQIWSVEMDEPITWKYRFLKN